jgi:RNA polymerase sigma factor for flagellar operon FliA
MPEAPDAPETVARIHEGMTLVDMLAKQLRQQLGGADLDDLRSAGREALVHAARSFDPSLGVPFRRWANLRIRGGMIDAVRAQGGLPRRIHNRLRAIEAGDRMSDASAEDETQKPTTTAVEADMRLGSYLAGIATAMAVGLLAPAVHGEDETTAALDPVATAEEQLAEHEILPHVR